MQERQFPPSDTDDLVPAERAALRRVRTRRLQALLGGAGAVLLTLFSVGCPEPADLENPGQYQPPPGGTTSTAGSATSGAATGGSATGADPCEVDCVSAIFIKSPTLCALCHNGKPTDQGGLKSSMLDLSTPGYTARLKNVAAKHGDLGMGMTAADCPMGDKLIDTATPANSWLLKKIDGGQGNCGTSMPPAPPLTMDQKTCLHTYISCVAGGAVTTGAGGTAAAAAGSGSGGTGGT